MAGVVHIPWYATVFRADQFAEALEEIAGVAMRYNATEYAVYRSRDDAYRFLQMATFEDKQDFERYWNGEEFSLWRGDFSSFYTVPVLYVWHDLVVRAGDGRAVDPGRRIRDAAHDHVELAGLELAHELLLAAHHPRDLGVDRVGERLDERHLVAAEAAVVVEHCAD